MDSENRIRQLLEKYWACETSLEEEQELKKFFGSNTVPGELKETGELFRYFDHQKKASLTGSDFDGSVLDKIRKAEPMGKSAQMFTFVARIAAGLFVVVAATFLVRREIRKSYPAEIADTYSDPKLALEETKKAFMMISRSFNRAENEAKKINLLNEAEEKISGVKEEVKKSDSI